MAVRTYCLTHQLLSHTKCINLVRPQAITAPSRLLHRKPGLLSACADARHHQGNGGPRHDAVKPYWAVAVAAAGVIGNNLGFMCI